MNAKITSEEPKHGSAIIAGMLKWLLVNIVFLLILGASLFLAAGRMDWWLGWIFLGVITAGQTATTLILLATNPTLLGERAWMQKGSKFWDKVIVSLSEAGWIAMVIVAGLDVRFGWSPRLGGALPVTGLALMVLGYALFLWAMVSNRFFSSFVRIQTDRGHSVATGGPYRYVRHPGYVGALLTYLASPLALAALWTFIPAALMLILFIFRTALEDRTLQAELTGYAAYARRVRFRLLPGVW
jgi:protein-S-isoprenylcysteine O-methyltransferase Ste14